jgi:hypothetical protein
MSWPWGRRRASMVSEIFTPAAFSYRGQYGEYEDNLTKTPNMSSSQEIIKEE